MRKDKRVVAVVQARMGSTRLPGKSMMDLGGRPLIENVLRRVAAAKTPAAVVLAIPDLPRDEMLAGVALELGLHAHRGSESDVLGRFIDAAKPLDADVVVRICADNPLVAPEEIDRAVSAHLDSEADYTFNHIPDMGNGYPDGLGAEVVDFSVLERIAAVSGEPRHREHVTVYVRDHPESFAIQTVAAPRELAFPDVKLDVDTPGDMERMRALFEHAPARIQEWKAVDIVRAYRRIFPDSSGTGPEG